MHTIFLLSALLLAVTVSGVGSLLLRTAPLGRRRPISLVVLATPVLVLVLAVFHIVPPFWPECAPLSGWDEVTSLGLLLTFGGVALGALCLSLARLALIERMLGACPVVEDVASREHLSTIAQRLGLRPPVLRLLRSDRPLAVTGGLRRPTIVLSSWMIEQLGHRELEAVLAHELAHLAQRDAHVRWFGRLLRDATIYLPGSLYAFRALEEDEELMADELAVEVTRRPLSMASALGRVWRAASASGPADLASLPGYAGDLGLLEERVSRLLGQQVERSVLLPGRLLAAGCLLLFGMLAPRLLAASALPLVCTTRPF